MAKKITKKTLDSFLKKHKAKIDKGREERRKQREEMHAKRQEFDAKVRWLEGEVIRPAMKTNLDKMETFGHTVEVLRELEVDLYPYRHVSYLINPYGLPDFLKLTFYGNAEDMKIYVRTRFDQAGVGGEEENSYEVDEIIDKKIEEILVDALAKVMQ